MADVQYFRTIAHLGVQVADALAYAHHHKIIHRDIKPSNLLLDSEGTVWITDFGLAKAEGSDELTHTGDIVGTLRYMAPERFEGVTGAAGDVYGLGITLYELLTLQPAFEESDRVRLMERVARESPPPPRRVDPRIPRDLETIVLKKIWPYVTLRRTPWLKICAAFWKTDRFWRAEPRPWRRFGGRVAETRPWPQ